MSAKPEKIDVWSAEIRDEVGGLETALAPLVEAGADFSFIIARRQPDKPGAGVVFLSGIRGGKQTRAAEAAGFAKSDVITALRLEKADKPGAVRKVVSKLTTAGINLRGLSASVVGSKCSLILAFDGTADRDTAAKLLRK